MRQQNNTYDLVRIRNDRLAPVLSLDPIYNAHSLYVCEEKPESTSIAAISKFTGAIEAALITGQPDVFLLQGYWLSAGNRVALDLVLDELEEKPQFTINFPLWAEEVVRQRFPRGDFQYDNLYIFTRNQLDSSLSGLVGATRLTRSLYDSLTNTDKFMNQLLPDDLCPESSFYCITEHNSLCGIGEHILETGSVSVVSQMYTLEEYRGKGYATQIAYALTETILSRNRIPISFFSETNISSKRVFERLGYNLFSRLGYLSCSGKD